MNLEDEQMRASRLRDAGAANTRSARQCSPNAMAYAILALADVMRAATVEICDTVERVGRVEVPQSVVDLIIPFEAEELEGWAGRMTGPRAEMLHAMAAIKRVEDGHGE